MTCSEQLAPETATADNGLWFLNNHVAVKVARMDNAAGISVLEHRSPFGEAPPVHVHHDEDEIFHVLSGTVRYELAGETVVAQTGDTVLAPRGVPHGFRVISPAGARVLTITSGGFEDMVRSVSRPAPCGALPEPKAPDAAMQARLGRECAIRGIDLLGPPIA